jgi:hypothetical protein
MKIALFYNVFRGGEGAAFAFQRDLLISAGHTVRSSSEADNREVQTPIRRRKTAVRARWSRPAYRRVVKFLQAHSVQLGHVHNWFRSSLQRSTTPTTCWVSPSCKP